MSWETLGIELVVSAALAVVWALIYYSGIPQKSWNVHGPVPVPSFAETATLLVLATILVGSIFLLADLVTVVTPDAYRLFVFLVHTFGLRAIEIGMGVGVLTTGFLAYWFKMKNQGTYGFVEIIFAGAAAVVATKQMSTTAEWGSSVATLIGAVYVVSRGMGNVSEGLEKRRRAIDSSEARKAVSANSTLT